MSYPRFFAMIATSTVVMFALMYFNTYALEHVRFSETRLYMALLMGAAMAVIMLAFMFGMYKSRRLNISILGAAVIIFGGSPPGGGSRTGCSTPRRTASSIIHWCRR